MSSTFTGFSEEDLRRIKSEQSGTNSALQVNTTNIKKAEKLGAKPKRQINPYKLPALQKQDSDDNIETLFDKCKLSIKTPTSPSEDSSNNNSTDDNRNTNDTDSDSIVFKNDENTNTGLPSKNSTIAVENHHELESMDSAISSTSLEFRRTSSDSTPDLVRCVDGYTEGEIAAHKAKLQELQLQQKIMEEQNKKRKEMLSKALADRTKQTVEEVQRLEKIKKELQVLDGQFSQDVAMLRRKIDQACLSYAETEKHYLKVEKEFLQAKIQLQKEKEKKELLTEHLCALITHNETRKAQKLETLMLELASDTKLDANQNDKHIDINDTTNDDEEPVIVDGVDQKTVAVSTQEMQQHGFEHILFLHSFTGCDTTSATFRRSKVGFSKLYFKSDIIKEAAVIFYKPTSTYSEVEEAGKMCFLKWYGAPARLTSLNEFRYQSFVRSVANIKPDFSSLPPTENAAKQHSQRTYHQVQLWLGNELPPQEWGWKHEGDSLVPITTEDSPAPETQGRGFESRPGQTFV